MTVEGAELVLVATGMLLFTSLEALSSDSSDGPHSSITDISSINGISSVTTSSTICSDDNKPLLRNFVPLLVCQFVH